METQSWLVRTTLRGLLQSLTKQVLAGITGKGLNRGSKPFLTKSEDTAASQKTYWYLLFMRRGKCLYTDLFCSQLILSCIPQPAGTEGSSFCQYWGSQTV